LDHNGRVRFIVLSKYKEEDKDNSNAEKSKTGKKLSSLSKKKVELEIFGGVGCEI